MSLSGEETYVNVNNTNLLLSQASIYEFSAQYHARKVPKKLTAGGKQLFAHGQASVQVALLRHPR